METTNTENPTATFTRDGKPAALKSLLFVLFFGPIAVFTGGRIASMLGTSVLTAQAAGTVVPTLVVALLGYVYGGRGTVSFDDDAVHAQRRTVPYEDIALAVREDSFSTRLFGAATFRLFVPDGTTLTLRYVNDPDAVGRLLTNHLTAPTQQVTEAPAEHASSAQSGGPEFIDARWRFWQYWRADEPLPETAVVDLDELKRVMDVGAVKVDRIDRVDMRDAEGLSDIDKNDVTSSSSSQTHP